MNKLQKINGAELAHLARAGVIADADGLRREVSKALAALNPAALVALAMSIAPDESAAVALRQLKDKTTELLGLLSASSEEAHAAQRAERERLAGVVAAAGRRSLEIATRESNIDGRVAGIKSHNESKRERLSKAGLSGAELENASAPTSYDELLSERAAILAEQAALEEFLKTRDTAHLPEGFADKVREVA